MLTIQLVSIWACSCTRVVLIHESIKIPNYARVFHNNEITPTDISTLLTTLSSLGLRTNMAWVKKTSVAYLHIHVCYSYHNCYHLQQPYISQK